MLMPMVNPSWWQLKRDHKHAAAAILNKQAYYLDEEDTYRGIKNDFDIYKWAAPEFLAQAGKELLEDMIEMKKLDKIPTMQGRVG